MSRKSVQRFCGYDMRKIKDLKHGSESERSRRALGRRSGCESGFEVLLDVGDILEADLQADHWTFRRGGADRAVGQADRNSKALITAPGIAEAEQRQRVEHGMRPHLERSEEHTSELQSL